MTAQRQKNGWTARIAVGLTALVLLISAAAYAVNANNTATLAREMAEDHEVRLRAYERTQAEMAADVRLMRILMEQAIAKKETP